MAPAAALRDGVTAAAGVPVKAEGVTLARGGAGGVRPVLPLASMTRLLVGGVAGGEGKQGTVKRSASNRCT